MPSPDLFLDPHEPDERLERWLDGDLPPTEAAQVAHAVRHYEAWQQAERAARVLQSVLHRTPTPVAPPDFTRRVLREVTRHEWEARTQQPRVPLAERLVALLRVSHWQPALALAALVLVAVAFWPRPPQPTEAEVAQSLEDVRWTLAYLSNTGEKAGLMVRDRVVVPHVVGPVRHALETSLEESNTL